MAFPGVVRIQPSLVSLIVRCCICSKSAAKSLPKVEAGYQLNAGPIRRRRLDRAARKRRFLGLSWLTGRDASLSSHPALGLRCRLGGGIYPFFGPSKLCAAPVAQLDRALPSEGRGREFESRRVRQLFRHFFERKVPRSNRSRREHLRIFGTHLAHWRG